MYHQVCWVTGQLDNLSWEGHDKFLPSLCGQMWVGREAGYLYSLRIQPASLEHCFVEPALTAGGWLFGRSLPAMAWHIGQRFEHVRAPQFCRWGEEHTEQSLLSQLVDWTPASESQKGEILCSCTHSSPPCSPHWTGRGRTLLTSVTLWWKKGVKRRDWFHWLVMNLQRFQ